MFVRPISVFFILAIAVLAGGVFYLHSELGNLRDSHVSLKSKYDKLLSNQSSPDTENTKDDFFSTTDNSDKDALTSQKRKLDKLEEEFRVWFENLKNSKINTADAGEKISTLDSRVKSLESGVFNVEGFTREQLKEEMKKINEEIRNEERERMARSMTDRILEDLTKKLELNNAQKEQISKIIDDGMAEMQQFFTSIRSGNVSREEIRKEMQKLRDEADQQISSILTAEQKTKYEEYKKENQILSPRFGGRREGTSPRGQGNQ